MQHIPKPQEIYRHFKGNLYQVMTIAEHSETGERLVIYQALYGDFRMYARPLEMFMEKVDKEKYPDAAQAYRFELQERGAEQEGKAGRDDGARQGGHSERDGKPKQGKDSQEWTEAELKLDPMVLEFLDADSYARRLSILSELHHRITDEMITTMAVASDIEIEDGDTEERYAELRNCLATLEKYECNRLRSV